jgi:hypothetical protein
MKASFFLSILSAITVSSVTERSTLFFRRSIPILICIAGVALYYIVNLPGKYSIKGDRYAVEKEIGEFINRNANNNEIVF